MKKVLFYSMTGEKMCFQHILLNAIDLHGNGAQVKIIFEGASVKLVPVLEKENNPLYKKAKDLNLIAGICFACQRQWCHEENQKTGLKCLMICQAMPE